MPCCECCCGNQTCTEGQEGKCCCGGSAGVCCQEGEYCCDGVCENAPCDDPPPPDAECCEPDGSCSDFCPGPNCDATSTPDGVCCDDVCIICEDCGVGGEECCNSVRISSLFAPLTDQSETILVSIADREVGTYSNPLVGVAWAEWSARMKRGEIYKFSLLWRSHVLDGLEAIEAGAPLEDAMQTSMRNQVQFANLYRAIINE